MLGFYVVRNIALATYGEKSYNIAGQSDLTRSFAPRFKNRAPAKNLDRLAMMVIYTVRP